MRGGGGAHPPGPTFFVLGAAKSGTTSLCDALARHPDVFFSRPKEPVFFEREYERGLDWYWNEYFSDWSGQPVVGEGRVFNLYLDFVPERIQESLPEARLVAILRDPVERAHSHWWHRVTRGYERRSFEEAVHQEREEIQAGRTFRPRTDPAAWDGNFFPNTRGVHADVRELRYLEMGHYAEQLQRYFGRFGRDRIRVVLFEDLKEDAGGLIRGLWDFLGADPGRLEPRVEVRNVAGGSVKSRPAFLLERVSWALGARRLVPKPMRDGIRRMLSRDIGGRPELRKTTRDTLSRHFAPHNRRLEGLLGRSLDGWTS